MFFFSFNSSWMSSYFGTNSTSFFSTLFSFFSFFLVFFFDIFFFASIAWMYISSIVFGRGFIEDRSGYSSKKNSLE